MNKITNELPLLKSSRELIKHYMKCDPLFQMESPMK
jgi:hypothetical protein